MNSSTKESFLQISNSHLKNRMQKKIWQKYFKNLLETLFKLNLQCVMLSTEKPLFDWNQTFRPPIWHLEYRMKKKVWHNEFKNLLQKLFRRNLQWQNSVFNWNQTFKARIWHLQNHMHKKIWRNDSRIWFKSARKRICIASCSRDRIHFLTGIKSSELESDISRIFCTRKFDTMIQEFGSKALENEFVVCHALETEFTFWLESNLQSSNLTSPKSLK